MSTMTGITGNLRNCSPDYSYLNICYSQKNTVHSWVERITEIMCYIRNKDKALATVDIWKPSHQRDREEKNKYVQVYVDSSA